MRAWLALALLLIAAAPPSSEPEPPRYVDPRIRIVTYSADEVVPLSVLSGFQLTVELGRGKHIDNIAIGDSDGWIIIRKQVISNFRLSDLTKSGIFDTLDKDVNDRAEQTLFALMRDRQWEELLRIAVQSRKTILISGGTATGKTTFLNALLREIPLEERIIAIEDTAELDFPHANAVGLIAARSALGEATVSAESLVAASMRMRPDRVIIGGVRGNEAFSFLRAINTGHPGSMTSIHADSPEGAIDQLALLVLQGGSQLRRADIQDYVMRTIGLFVQLGRAAGRRFVSDIALRSRDGKLLRR